MSIKKRDEYNSDERGRDSIFFLSTASAQSLILYEIKENERFSFVAFFVSAYVLSNDSADSNKPWLPKQFDRVCVYARWNETKASKFNI